MYVDYYAFMFGTMPLVVHRVFVFDVVPVFFHCASCFGLESSMFQCALFVGVLSFILLEASNPQSKLDWAYRSKKKTLHKRREAFNLEGKRFLKVRRRYTKGERPPIWRASPLLQVEPMYRGYAKGERPPIRRASPLHVCMNDWVQTHTHTYTCTCTYTYA